VVGLCLVSAAARLAIAPAILESAASPTTFHNAVEMATAQAFSPATPARMIELAALRMAETRPSVLHGDFLACEAFDLSPRVGEICQPTLVVCGADDRVTTQRDAQFLASSLPKARLEVIPDAGHMVMLEKPGAVAGLLFDFMSGIRY
jgi:pimeloyl-ACP methyl ester carboxylesterase